MAKAVLCEGTLNHTLVATDEYEVTCVGGWTELEVNPLPVGMTSTEFNTIWPLIIGLMVTGFIFRKLLHLLNINPGRN